jgi:CMP-N-acetylneuraminic acid synthetase
MGFAALIPARGGSKGVPGKNIKSLGGHPLLSYSIAACKLSKNIDQIFVSTDDKMIADIAEAYGAIVPGLRPEHLASDTSTDWDVINHFFENNDDEEVVYLRPTTPTRKSLILDKFIEVYTNLENDASGFRSMHELPEPPYKMLMIENGYCKGFFSDFNGIEDYTNLPRQVFPKAYHPNGYIDIATRDTVISCKTAFGTKIFPFITPFVTEIDTIEEFELLQYKIEKHKDNNILSYLDNLGVK